MKVTKSFSLEVDILERIMEYKEKYKISNSSALERIILEHGIYEKCMETLLNGKDVKNVLNSTEIVKDNYANEKDEKLYDYHEDKNIDNDENSNNEKLYDHYEDKNINNDENSNNDPGLRNTILDNYKNMPD